MPLPRFSQSIHMFTLVDEFETNICKKYECELAISDHRHPQFSGAD